jgi:UDP-N-acetylglucosamine 2-epimerase (non-hydrolysing)
LKNVIENSAIKLMPPQSYLDFLALWRNASLVLTDSGGLQEETTALGIPCFTLRENTERPVTVEEGTNTLVGTTKEGILRAYAAFRAGCERPAASLHSGTAGQRGGLLMF